MTTAKKKNLGFGGQWVPAFSVGKHIGLTKDGEKKELVVTQDFLKAIEANYDVALHEAPATIGHPEHDAPAYGWISGVRVNSDKLELQFSDVEPQFEQMVKDGRFKKRSLRLYTNPSEAPGGRAPSIRHCAFLGAMPPAIKGLENIETAQFNDDEGETLAIEIEFSEGEFMTDAEKKAAEEAAKKTMREAVTEFLKEKFGFGKDEAKAAASFSEADAQSIVDKAVAAAELKFSETLKDRDTKIEELTKRVNAQTGNSHRAEILQFCESNLKTVLPAFKEMGLVEFMESLAASDEKVTVISFAEDGKQEKKEFSRLEWFKTFMQSLPPFIQFGETFGALKVTDDGSKIVDSKQTDILRAEFGLKTPEATAKK